MMKSKNVGFYLHQISGIEKYLLEWVCWAAQKKHHLVTTNLHNSNSSMFFAHPAER
jgi:hypothetical protein